MSDVRGRGEFGWFGALGLLHVVACGPKAPDPEGEPGSTTGSTSTTDPDPDPSDPDPSDPDPSDPDPSDTNPPPPDRPCDVSEDCGYCSVCSDGLCTRDPSCCYYDYGYYGPTSGYGGGGLRACMPGYVCVDDVCSLPPRPLPLPTCDPLPFSASQWFLGETPDAFVLADIDGDDDLDLIAVNSFVQEVGLTFNDGTGAFEAGPSFLLGSFPSAAFIGVGDLDGDDDLDLAVASGTEARLVLLLNDGMKFTASEPLETPGVAEALIVTDLSNDGIADILTSNEGVPRIAVWISDGSGGVGPVKTLKLDGLGRGAALADIDGDDFLDLLVPPGPGTSDLQVLLGGANGGFGSFDYLNFGESDDSTRLLAVDIAGAPIPAIVAITTDSEGGLARTWVPTGTIQWSEPPIRIATTSPLTGGVLAMIDDDDALDLVAATGGPNIAVLLGDGAGSFTCEQTHAVAEKSTSRGLAIGDLDGDTRPEIVVASGGTQITVLRTQ